MLAVTGLLLLFYYSPAPQSGPRVDPVPGGDVWGGAYLRSLHRLASHALLVLVALHTLRVILTGAFLHPRKMNWIVGCSLLVPRGLRRLHRLPAADGPAGLLGHADRDGARAGAARSATRSARLLVPDDVGGPLSLLRFYALHVVIVPAVMLVLTMLHFFVIRRQKGLLPYL